MSYEFPVRQRSGGVEARIAPDGRVWMLVTTNGGNDPDGLGGYVVGELGGSGCRWLEFDPADPEGSLERLEAARAFHGGG